MSGRYDRRGPAHMAGRKNSSSSSGSRQRREPLRDNYYYEEPRRGSRQEFEDVESYSSSGRKRADQRELKRQRKKKGSTAKKVVIITLVIFALLVAAGFYYVFGYLLKDLTVTPITKNKQQLGIVEEEVQMDDSIKNIALFGTDSRSNDNSNSRADITMILTVDNKHKKIKMTSILRDSNVSIPLEDSNGDLYYTPDKITHAYHYGGPEAGIAALNRNFYLNIEDFVTVNFTDMAKIVDAFGGVDIQLSGAEVQQLNQNLWDLSQEILDQKEIDQSNGITDQEYAVIQNTDIIPNIYGNRSLYSADYEYEERVYHLNGNQAVAYARIRHLEGGDDVRAERQQTVLKALISQARGRSKLEYPEMIRQLMPLTETSLTFDDIVAMIPIMLTDFTVETMTIPGEEENAYGKYNITDGWSRWVYCYDLESAARRINQFIYEDEAQPDKIGGRDDVYGVSNLTFGSYSDTPLGDSSDDPDLDAPPPSTPDPDNNDTSSDPNGGGTTSDPNGGDTSDPSGGGVTSDPNGGGTTSDPNGGGENSDPNGGGGGGEDPSGGDTTGGETGGDDGGGGGGDDTWLDIPANGGVTE